VDYRATQAFRTNLVRVLRTLRDSIFRRGKATSDRARSQAIFQNFYWHIHSVRVHRYTLRPVFTWGLGAFSFAFFAILCLTGILLMVYYKPSVSLAYDSIKDLHYVVPTGRFIRNLHRWAAHGMVVAVILHMARVFYTGSYRKPREFNWLLGMTLLVLTLGLSFTGYLLPWDQLGYWATVIGSNIAGSPREVTDVLGITPYFDPGAVIRQVLLGSNSIGEEALIRFYLLHVIVLPLALGAIVSVHFWRIRKDGGLSRPEHADPPPPEQEVFRPNKTYGLMALVKGKTPAVDREPENTLPSWPYLLLAELAVLMLAVAVSMVLAYHFDAPLKEPANPAVPENPAKAPWYFLGVQELVSYSAFMGGIGIPLICLIGLALIPYLDRERGTTGVWFDGKGGLKVAAWSLVYSALVVVGILFVAIRYGWLRNWFPAIPQWVIILVNPGTVLVLAFALWSVAVMRTKNSTRLAAIALFTCFLVGFTILTYVATIHRGPNWEFFWTKGDWPIY
jgi:quinol-cytochrome oxidoreductase complex cytochrome b subunit